MITLLASIAGFITSIIPELIKYYQDINDKKHELNILEKQINSATINDQNNLAEIQISQDNLIQASLHSNCKTDIKWIDSLNGSVRPVLAYCFFLLYVIIKYFQYLAIMAEQVLIEYIEIIWNVNDQAIFASIISFYYGHRTFRNIHKKNI